MYIHIPEKNQVLFSLPPSGKPIFANWNTQSGNKSGNKIRLISSKNCGIIER
jgi:hypothetical protein